MMFESLGDCGSYIEGKAVVSAALPAKAPYCQYCNFISYHSAYDRHICRITGEYILNYKKERGEQCPFIWEDKDG